MKQLKLALKVLLLVGVTGYLVYAIIQLRHPSEEMICEGVEVVIKDSLEDNLVNKAYIMEVLGRNKIHPKGQKMDKIDLQGIVSLLTADPYIELAETYYTSSGKLCLTIHPMHPVMHIMAQNGEEYYLDRGGTIIPIGSLNADLPIVTGNIKKKYASTFLAPLGCYIQDHEFWRRQVQQIHVESEKSIVLYPRIGEHTILLGDATNYEDKFSRMLLFYKQGLSVVGWNKYETISLAYDGQVVCTKR